ncbi:MULTISPECIES: phthiocerol/phthiodiolone dimycocerosyl transferase family protein [Mycolicibacterium]|uniref:phthiocerol/phthiodiolone dimycocerosyl transferase family protein n=1 Tax=Mycolicibacterium monacense TaxID=85693 RepID=UPI0007EB6418|nr:acyltransferase [Mycolicibacterium monacense]OBB62269.1 acyltransferase [Mycolicibacterium monacense]OBF47216.1 acyltransferase [Mycolicibacterium monacense]
MAYSTSVIRRLAPSEKFFAETQTFTSITVLLDGTVDIDAMADAFDALLEAYPVYAGHLEPDSDGGFELVADDLLHPGLWVQFEGDPAPTDQLDQGVALIYLLVKPDSTPVEVTLFIHHSLADGTHMAGLLFELFARYTEVVTTGSAGPVSPNPAPEPIETVLEQRGIRKQQRSGLDRFIPAMFAYELPPKRLTTRSAAERPAAVPTTRCRLSKAETSSLVKYGRVNRLFVNNLISAAILLAEWQVRRTPHIPIPYVYNVNLRALVEPPVSATGCTLAIGVATYLAHITPQTTMVELARGIADMFQADLADGVVQQSLLHFNMQYEGAIPGLPDVVLSTNLGNAVAMSTPPGLEVVGVQSQFYRASSAVIDVYSFGVVGGELLIEHHVDAAETTIDLIRSLLRSVVSEHQH